MATYALTKHPKSDVPRVDHADLQSCVPAQACSETTFREPGLLFLPKILPRRAECQRNTIQEPHFVNPRSFSFHRYYAGGPNIILRPASVYDFALKFVEVVGNAHK